MAAYIDTDYAKVMAKRQITIPKDIRRLPGVASCPNHDLICGQNADKCNEYMNDRLLSIPSETELRIAI